MALDDGSCQEAKNFQVGSRGAGDSEGVVGPPFAQVKADRLFEGAGEFLKCATQGFLKRGAVVLREHFLGDEEGKNLSLAHLQKGKGLHLFGVAEGVAGGVVLDGEAEAVSHEVEVSLDRFIGNLKVFA